MTRRMIFLSLLLFMFLASTSTSIAATQKTIVFSNNQWDSQLFHNAVAKFIVENGFDGYKVNFSTGSSNLNWQAIIIGDVDLDIESWTENVATYQRDVAEKTIIPLGVLVPDSAQGFYVPRYVIKGDAKRGIKAVAPQLRTVEDLKKYASVFKDPETLSRGRIYGAIPGWMIDEIMFKKYKHYKLDKDYNYFRVGSEAVLFASIASAYNLREPWVGYCYEPTWVTGNLDLILLEDAPYNLQGYKEGKTEIPKQPLRIVSSSYFSKKAPDLVPFFSKYRTGSKLVSKALAHIKDSGDSHEKVAIWFLKNNDVLLDQWLAPENAKKVRDVLGKI